MKKNILSLCASLGMLALIAMPGLTKADDPLGLNTSAVSFTNIIVFGSGGNPADDSLLDMALRDLTAAIQANPNRTDAYHYRAQIYMELGQWEKVKEDCTEILRLQPDHYDALLWRARAFRKLAAARG